MSLCVYVCTYVWVVRVYVFVRVGGVRVGMTVVTTLSLWA